TRKVKLVSSAIPRVRGKQLTKVALTHQSCRDGLRLGIGSAFTDPIFRHKPEELLAPGIPLAGNRYWPADGKSKVVIAVRRGKIGGRTQVSTPGIRVHVRVLEVLVESAMEIGRSALRHDANLTAARASVLSLIVRGQNLNLLRGIDVRDTNNGAIGACAHGRCTVNRYQRILRARAIDGKRIAARSNAVLIAKGPTAADAWQKLSRIDRAAAVEF